jgi:hypothetical protein
MTLFNTSKIFIITLLFQDPSERNTSDLELDEQLRKIHNIFQQYDTIAK